jgi:MFS family permease
LLVLVVAPFCLVLLRGQGERHTAYLRRNAARPGGSGGGWSRRRVLRDWRFWVLAPAMMSPSFVLGGFFFHQAPLAAEKGWEMSWLAVTFVGYALGVVVTSFTSGPLIDRFGAVRLVAFKLPPVALGALALALIDAPLGALVFMVAAGIGAGMGYTLTGATFAELYGTAHFGAIRGVVMAIQAAMGGASPYLFGVLIDSGVSLAAIGWASAILVAFATTVTWGVLRRSPGPPPGESAAAINGS